MLYEGRLEEAQQIAAANGVVVDWKAVMSSRGLRDLESGLVVPAYGLEHVDEYYAQDACHWRMQVGWPGWRGGLVVPEYGLEHVDECYAQDACHCEDAGGVAWVEGGHGGTGVWAGACG